MSRRVIVAFVGSLVILAPFGAAAAVIAEQPVFTDNEHITGDSPMIFSGASGRTPSLMSLFSATGTVKTAKIRYSMPSWPGANGLYAYLYECPLHVGDTLPQCRRIVSHDAALGWDGSLLHPPVANNGELTIGFNDAQAEGFGDEIFTSGVPLNPARGYRLEAVFTPNTFSVDVSGAFGTTSAGGFYPYFKLEGDGPVEATTTPDKPDPVIIVPGILGSMEHNGVWEIDPILHGYDDLIATLDANGYTPNVDLFTFPYDWHSSNVDTAVLLKGRIDQVKAICGCTKVDLVAHSMGGLVARQYIQSASYQHDVDQIIFLGTPHLGAPKAYLMWEGGEFGDSAQSLVLSSLMKHEAKEHGYTDAFTYMRQRPIPSVKELLPVYDYIFDGNSLRDYPTNYPANQFLEQLKAGFGAFIGSSGVRISNIVGTLDSNQTVTALNSIAAPPGGLKWEHGIVSSQYGIGDGTVPFVSAASVSSSTIAISSDHLSLPFDSEANIFNILTGKEASIVSTDLHRIDAKFLIVKMLSPADLLLVAPDGKKIGRDVGGVEVNELPQAFYTGYTTDTEFIAIPNPIEGDYRIFTTGTGSGGQFTIEADYINQGSTVTGFVMGSSTPGQTREYSMALGIEPLVQSVDVTPPTLTMNSPVEQDYSRSQLIPVQVIASDASGISSLITVLGTTTVPNVGNIDPFLLKLGKYKVIANAVDGYGNISSTTKNIRLISTPDGILSDLERCYGLGWVSKSARDSLAKKIQAAIKISKIIEKRADGRQGSERVVKVIDKILAAAILLDIQQLRGRGVNDQAYSVLRDDLIWLINN